MIDFHCHLDLYLEPQVVVKECVLRGIYALAVTTTPSAWQGTSELISGADRIRVALGLHPELARERRSELELFDQFLPRTRYVGEIGLDGSLEMRKFWTDQKFVFDRILAACQAAGGKIMTIHSRRAVTEVLNSLEAYPGAGTPILHWYSGGSRELARAVDLGCWFSVGPAMLNGEKGRKLAALMPMDRVLTETDGPFAMVNGHAAFPWDVEFALGALGDLWKTDKSFVQSTIHDNLRRLTQR
jgi:TatD DNase family protein